MMDLKEATASLNHYTQRLGLTCTLYSQAVANAEKTEKDETLKDLASRYRETLDKAILDLTTLQREALALRILIQQASETEVDRLMLHLDDFLALRDALDRNVLSLNKATDLLDKHYKKEEEQEKRRQPGSLEQSWAEFRRKRAEERKLEEAEIASKAVQSKEQRR